MEENVALDSSKQKKFDKSIKGIKKLIKKKDAGTKAKVDTGEVVEAVKVDKKKRPQRGLVYLSHIPHGFYENEMTQYFKQFGVVTNARVIKSKKTGRSRGFAFVEFKEPAVAQIVAETMNNYLMGKRLLKAAYIPPEKQRRAFRKRWNAVNNPGNKLRIKMKKVYNANKDEEGDLIRARKILANINKTKQKLSELGINYDFFAPVDVPEVLIKEVQIKLEDVKENIADIGKSKKKGKKTEKQDKPVKKETLKDVKTKLISSNIEIKREQNKKEDNRKEQTKNNESKHIMQDKANKNIQKQKKQNLKDKGVTPLEDFIKVEEGSDDGSESLIEFDSDEYEKMLESDSDSFDDQDDAESDESEEKIQPKKTGKNKGVKVVNPIKQLNMNKNKTQKKSPPQEIKRKAQEQPVAPVSKKIKFEKQINQKPRNKQFKKKK